MNIKAKFLALICLTPLVSSSAFCDILGDQLWVAATPMLGFEELSLKTATENKGWAISYTAYEPDAFGYFSDLHRTKNGDENINREVSEISVLRFYRANTRYLYADFGFGLGYLKGSKEKNCVKQGSTLFGANSYRCDEEDVSELSIPVEVNLAVGRYAGIGITIRTSISEASPGVMLGITYSFGQFTHGNE